MKISRVLPDFVIMLLSLSLLASSALRVAHSAGTEQTVRSAAAFASERGAASRRGPASLMTYKTENRQTDTSSGKQSALDSRHDYCCAYDIYWAETELFDDFDRDGFYTYLRISLDIDTDYEQSELYLQVYLRGSVGPWSLIFDSNVFTINGNSGLDTYEVESELIAGYPADYYDVLVEVYDAYTGELVLDYGPAESVALSLLPMEEVSLDARTVPPTAVSSGGGGGSLSLTALAGLLLLLLLRHSEASQNPKPNRSVRTTSSRGRKIPARAFCVGAAS